MRGNSFLLQAAVRVQSGTCGERCRCPAERSRDAVVVTSSDANVAADAGPVRRARWITFRRARRAGVALVLLTAVLYALLPWLIPKRWLADRIAAEIAGAMNRATRIGTLRLSWTDGVVIEQLTIDRRPGFGTGPFARVDRIQTAFSPLGAVLGRPIEHLKLDEPEVWVVIVTENGVQRLNIADLGAEGTQTTPSGEWVAVDAAVHIVEEHISPSSRPTGTTSDGAGEKNEVALRLGQLACQLDARTGRARWDIRGRLPTGDTSAQPTTRPDRPGGIATDGTLSMPKLKRGVKLSGGGKVSWDRLDLSTVPVHLIPDSDLIRMTGWSAGTLDIRVHEDLHVDVGFDTALSDVSVYRRDRDRPDRLTSADLSARGRWNPNADVLVLDTLDCQLPGLHVESEEMLERSPIRLALHGERRIDLDVTGEVTDIERLRRSLRELDALLGTETQARGTCRFKLSWRRMTTGDRLRVELDAGAAEIVRPDVIHLPVGDPASLRLDVSVDRRGELVDLRDFRVRLGPMSLQANGQLPLQAVAMREQEVGPGDPDALEEILQQARGEIRLGTKAADRLLEHLPVLAEPLRDVQLAGPMVLTLGLHPTQNAAGATVFRGYLEVPASSALSVGETFVKPAGQALSANAELAIGREQRGTLQGIGLDVRCGPGRAWIDPDESRARLAVQKIAAATATSGPSGASAGQTRYMAHAYVAATVHVKKIEALLAAVPKMTRRLARDGDAKGLTGDCTLMVESNLANLAVEGQMRPELWRAHLDVQATELGIDLGDQFSKPAGGRATIALDYHYDRSLPKLQHRHTGSFELAGLIGQGAYAWGGGYEQADVEIDVADVRKGLCHMPRAEKESAPYRLQGGALVTVRSRRGPERHVLSVAADASGLGLHLPGQEPFDKPRGVPCRLAATLESLSDTGTTEPHEMTIRQVVASIASCELRATDGRVVTKPGTHEKLTADYMARHPRWWLTTSPFRELEVSTTGTVVFDSTLRSLSPAIERAARRYDLIGSAEAAIKVSADPQGIRLAGRIHGDRVNINASPHLVKPPGTALRLTFDVASRDEPDRPGTTTGFVVRECGLRAWDMQFAGSGDFWVQHGTDTEPPRLGGFSLSATYDMPELAHFQKLMPSLLAEPMTGSVKGDVSLAAEGDQFRMDASTLTARDVRTAVNGEPVQLDGQVTLSSERVESEGLRLQLGKNHLTLAGNVEDLSRNPRGSVFVIAEELDLDDLRRFLARAEPAGDSSQASAATQPGLETAVRDAASQPLATQPSSTRPATTQTTDEERIAKAQPFFEFLKRCDLTGRAHIGRARVVGEKTKKEFVVDELVSDFKLVAGRVVLPFRCAMNGGMVEGKFTLTADRPNPYFDLTYEAVAIEAEDNVRMMVLYDFPGLHADGDVRLIDATHQRFFNEPNVLNYPVGEGEMIIDGGAYIGRAAPLWLTKIFPGLNTARYEFVRMHDWFKKHIDGRIDHHMIYQGAVYNIYMKGHSMVPTGRSHYEVGIDLLAGYDSKYWSETGQGRVALFTADARVEDGVEVEKIIRFVPLHRVITDVFFRNNVVTTAYYALKKQVTGQK